MRIKSIIFDKRKFLYFSLVVSFLFIILATFVVAFGVLSEYTVTRPLEAYPGQTVDTYFIIQNMIEDTTDMTVQASLTLGSEVASIIGGTRYDIPAGEQVEVKVRVEIPAGAAIGTEYIVAGLFEQVPSEEGEDTVGFSANINKDFKVTVVVEMPVEVEEAQPEGVGNFWLWVVGIIILIIIIWLVMKRKKKSSSAVPTGSASVVKGESQ